MSKYNFVILGSGIEALIVGQFLVQQNKSVLIVDESPKLGNYLAPIEAHGNSIESLYSYLPKNNSTLEALRFLNSKVSSFDISENISFSNFTFEKGQMEPFVGFGENAPQGLDLYSALMAQDCLELTNSISKLTSKLSEGIDFKMGVSVTDALVYDKKISALTFSDKKRVEADSVLFAQHPSQLAEVLPENTLTAKTISKLSQFKVWSRIQWTAIHSKEFADSRSRFVFYGTQKNPTVCIGQSEKFINSQNQEVITSQWTSFMDAEDQDLSELGVQTLKEMKRQIKRAFPDIFENLIFEKIAVQNDFHMDLNSDINSQGQLPELKNVWLCSPSLVSGAHIFEKTLLAAKNIIEALEASDAFDFQTENQNTEATNSEISL